MPIASVSVVAAMSAATAFAFSSFKSQMATLHPSLAKRRAILLPIKPAPPVMTAPSPIKRLSIFSSFLSCNKAAKQTIVWSILQLRLLSIAVCACSCAYRLIALVLLCVVDCGCLLDPFFAAALEVLLNVAVVLSFYVAGSNNQAAECVLDEVAQNGAVLNFDFRSLIQHHDIGQLILGRPSQSFGSDLVQGLHGRAVLHAAQQTGQSIAAFVALQGDVLRVGRQVGNGTVAIVLVVNAFQTQDNKGVARIGNSEVQQAHCRFGVLAVCVDRRAAAHSRIGIVKAGDAVGANDIAVYPRSVGIGITARPVVGGADRSEGDSAVAAVPQLVRAVDPRHGREVRLHQTILIQRTIELDHVQELGMQQAGHNLIVYQIGILTADAISGSDAVTPGGVVRHANAQANCVVLTVLVGIVVGECVEHVVQLVQGGGNFQTEVLQPVLAQTEHLCLHTFRACIRDAVDLAVKGERAEAAFLVCQDVLTILSQQIVQRQNYVVLNHFDQIHAVCVDDVRQLARRSQGCELGLIVFVGCYDGGTEVNAQGFIDGINDEVLLGRHNTGASLNQKRYNGLFFIGNGGNDGGRCQHRYAEQQGDQGFHCP
uniref:Uncharacterized protein n=1 Tax=uncultured bacterium fosmid pJB148G3 TaxID=1478052 RepID=A0A0H3U8D6_9BACT|nr:hypothetical protein [uncultured bacterium fosmid pJB148G3]